MFGVGFGIRCIFGFSNWVLDSLKNTLSKVYTKEAKGLIRDASTEFGIVSAENYTNFTDILQ